MDGVLDHGIEIFIVETPGEVDQVRAGLVTMMGPTRRRSFASTVPWCTTTSLERALEVFGTQSSGFAAASPSRSRSVPPLRKQTTGSAPAHNIAASKTARKKSGRACRDIRREGHAPTEPPRPGGRWCRRDPVECLRRRDQTELAAHERADLAFRVQMAFAHDGSLHNETTRV